MSLAFAQYQQGNASTAIATMQAAAVAIPDIAPAVNCFVANIEAGRPPQEGC
jgi:hypothetical protein